MKTTLNEGAIAEIEALRTLVNELADALGQKPNTNEVCGDLMQTFMKMGRLNFDVWLFGYCVGVSRALPEREGKIRNAYEAYRDAVDKKFDS